MKILTICTKNYKPGLDFCMPTWQKISGLKKITVITDFEQEDDGIVEYLQWMRPSTDWLEVVGRKVLMIKRYIAEENPDRFIFLDVDCYLTRDIGDVFQVPFDLAVTRLYHPKTASTGIIYFNVNNAVRWFLSEWQQRQSDYRNRGIGVRPHRQSYSQISFSDILREATWMDVFPLSGDVYNSEDDNVDRWVQKIGLYNPKVLHFKARRWEKKTVIDKIL